MTRWSAGKPSWVKSRAGAPSAVDHPLEREPVGRRHLGGSPPVTLHEDLLHGARVEAAVSYRDERPDESSNHLVQERVCPRRDVDPVTDPGDRQPFQPPHRPSRLRPPAERREVVLAQDGSRGAPHRRHGELTRTMPDEPSLERVRPRPGVDPISILASGGRVPGIEPLRRPTYLVGDDLGREHAVDGSLESFEVDVIVSDERHHLPSSVHTRVGPACDGELGIVTQGTRESVRENAFDGPLTGVLRPPTEPGAVVRERESNDHGASMTGSPTRPGYGGTGGCATPPTTWCVVRTTTSFAD
jgi:hypothetical protein